MSAKYSDEEIAKMIAVPKLLPADYRSRIQMRSKRGHKERELEVPGQDNGHYRLILRQSNSNTLAFSIILAVNPSDSNQLFRLRRYNGKNHEHTNTIEGDTRSTISISIRQRSATRKVERARIRSLSPLIVMQTSIQRCAACLRTAGSRRLLKLRTCSGSLVYDNRGHRTRL